MLIFCLPDEIRKKIAFIESSETAKHLRNAQKEVLLAIRALLDTAICEMEKKEERLEKVEVK